MAVHAHPDDETISTGGSLLRAADEGFRTVLVVCTGGEEGEIVDPEMDAAAVKPRLGEVRRGEMECAAAKLKVSALEWLGYRDSGMAGTPENDNPTSFHQASDDEATERLVRLVRRYRPHVLVSYDEHGSYGHPDHIKAARITRAAFARAADPSYAPTPNLSPWQPIKLYETAFPREMMVRWREKRREEALARGEALPDDVEDWFDIDKHTRPLDQITTMIDVRRYNPIRLDALRCHRTQIRADSDFFKEDPQTAEWWGKEYFNLLKSFARTPDKEDDLFAGLTIEGGG
jgi:mycothiol conjugate amidase Mca